MILYAELCQTILNTVHAQLKCEAFEYTLQTWLEYQVVPIYRALIKDRKRGIAKATL